MKSDILVLDSNQMEYISKLVEGGGVAPLNVTGMSMRPFISPRGDTVFLIQCSRNEIKKGDILLFKRDKGSVVLHRVRKIKGDTYIMNGDAQNWCEIINYNNVIAKVFEYEHNGKTIHIDDVFYKILISLWYPTYRFRPYIFALLRKVGLTGRK